MPEITASFAVSERSVEGADAKFYLGGDTESDPITSISIPVGTTYTYNHIGDEGHKRASVVFTKPDGSETSVLCVPENGFQVNE